MNASANARPLTRLRQPTFVSTRADPQGNTASESQLTLPLQRHRKPHNHTSCLTSRSGTPALGLTARAPASGTSANMHPEMVDLSCEKEEIGALACAASAQCSAAAQRDREEDIQGLERTEADLPPQPRLHPPRWSDPQVRPEHLPSVLPREGCRHWFRQGTTPPHLHVQHAALSTARAPCRTLTAEHRRLTPHSTAKCTHEFDDRSRDGATVRMIPLNTISTRLPAQRTSLT